MTITLVLGSVVGWTMSGWCYHTIGMVWGSMVGWTMSGMQHV